MSYPEFSTVCLYRVKSDQGLEDNRYLNMTFLAEQKKELLRLAA